MYFHQEKQMYKSTWLSKLSSIVPEAIALSLVVTRLQSAELFNICFWLLIYSLILRLIWQSAIIVHGLGHTMALAWAERKLSILNLTNILEHQSIVTILKSLLPYHHIFIPILTPATLVHSDSCPFLPVGNREYIRLKAAGGIFLNFLVAILFLGYSHNFLAQALIAANLLIASFSLTDLEALITGTADYFYCGNFGLIAQRQPDDEAQLLPSRLVDLALKMGQETEVRGEQAGGGLVSMVKIMTPLFLWVKK